MGDDKGERRLLHPEPIRHAAGRKSPRSGAHQQAEDRQTGRLRQGRQQENWTYAIDINYVCDLLEVDIWR